MVETGEAARGDAAGDSEGIREAVQPPINTTAGTIVNARRTSMSSLTCNGIAIGCYADAPWPNRHRVELPRRSGRERAVHRVSYDARDRAHRHESTTRLGEDSPMRRMKQAV